MTPALLAALAALATPSPIDTRIRESAAAAQALQGPLDGTWTLRDAAGRSLYVFRLSDPSGGGAITGAWRDARDPSTGPRVLTAVDLAGRRLLITLGSPAMRLRLRAITPEAWRGRLVGPNVDRSVSLERR